ncbi:hypothetical protein AX17_005330 [Amanita inopinata Kibby_2008]|nr:hypothetical protein AX17_005330 [Amanita inopinata Kibby_2008]
MFSQTIFGTLSSDGNGNFRGTFTFPDNTQRELSGKFSSAIPAFSVPIATVTHDKPLNEKPRIELGSLVGNETVNVKFDDGAVLGGGVMPPLDRAYNVTGAGTWITVFP